MTSALAAQPFSAPPRAADAPPMVKRWTREEYYRLGEQGWFVNQRVELIDGEIVEMSPQTPEHFLAIERVRRVLENAFGNQFWIRIQGPVTKGEFSEPEPDVCIVKGPPEAYVDHPTQCALIVEVSKSTLIFDKTSKQSLYASMNVQDYWVLDLENRQLLVHRQPVDDVAARFGRRYTKVDAVPAEGHVSPLEKPEAKLAVSDMLPPQK
jgi:Uma2 family endonuclease